MKIAAFGSCLANITISKLKAYDFEQVFSIEINRSDAFLKYFVDKSAPQIPLDLLMSKFVFKPESEATTRTFILNQYIEGLGFHQMMDKKAETGQTFFDIIENEQLDVILLDNYMDLASKLATWKDHPIYSDSPVFFDFGAFENSNALLAEFDYNYDYLSGAQSARNWMRIYRWLRHHQPKAKIFMLCYHFCSNRNHERRFTAAREFYHSLKWRSMFDDLLIVPPVTVVPELTKGEQDWPHFDDRVYDAIAGFLFLHISGGYGRPFRPFRMPA